MTDNFTNNPAAYLSELQRIEREQELAKLRTLSLEFAGVLDFFPNLREELQAFQYAEGIDFDGLVDRLRPILKQATDLYSEIGHLSGEMLTAMEMQTFVPKAKNVMNLQSVECFGNQFQGVCQDIHQRLAWEKRSAECRAKEEVMRQAGEKAEAVKKQYIKLLLLVSLIALASWMIGYTIGGGIGWLVGRILAGMIFGLILMTKESSVLDVISIGGTVILAGMLGNVATAVLRAAILATFDVNDIPINDTGSIELAGVIGSMLGAMGGVTGLLFWTDKFSRVRLFLK